MKDLYVLFHVTLRQLYELYTFIIYSSVEETDTYKVEKFESVDVSVWSIRSSIGLQRVRHNWATEHPSIVYP